MIRIMLMLFALSSCSQVGVGYYTEQLIGQSKIQWRARSNDEVLDDPKVDEEKKRKIMLVGEYKKFFYHYFSEKPTDIYTKTTMLEHKAVSYLVIATPHTKIEPHEFDFLFIGSFPYIGFLNRDSAKSFAKNLEKNGDLVTWIRPVYAYSTLGYLEDRILSSFFHYDDVELAELIFHELFHTIFFIKDEVDLNENMATLYGKELLHDYFKDRPELKAYLETEKKIEKRNARIVELIGLLKDEFAKLGAFLTNEKADVLTQRFIKEVFVPEILHTCQELDLSEDDCKIKDDWNQAAFAAFLTYEEEQDFLKHLKASKNLDLKAFLGWLKDEHKSFEKQEEIKSFTDYLKSKVPNATTAAN